MSIIGIAAIVSLVGALARSQGICLLASLVIIVDVYVV